MVSGRPVSVLSNYPHSFTQTRLVMQRILLLAGWLLLPAFLYSQTTTAKYFLKTLNCDQGTTMCFDAGGNLWVGARSQGRIQLAKMSADGALLDEVRINIDGGLNNLVEIIADSEGKIVGAGTFGDGFSGGFAFRYDPVTRKILWQKDLQGDLITIAGIVEKGPGGAFAVLSNTFGIDSPAELIVLNRNDGTLANVSTRAYSYNSYKLFNAAVYHQGAIYTTGTDEVNKPGELRIGISKINAINGVPEWTRFSQRDVNLSLGDMIGQDILVDNDSLVTAALGGPEGNPSSLTQAFLQKNALNGDLFWAKRYLLPEMNSIVVEEVLNLPDGYLLFGEAYAGPQQYFFLLKTDKNGEPKWAKRIGKEWAVDVPQLAYQSQILATSTGLFVLTDATESAVKKTYLIKTDLNGSIKGCDYVQPTPVVAFPILNPVNEKATLNSSSSTSFISGVSADLLTNPVLSVATQCTADDTITQTPSKVSIVCPANVSVTLPSGQTSMVVTYGQPTAATTCQSPALALFRAKGPASGSAFAQGVTQVCYQASDDCGASATCCFNVAVQAAPPPPGAGTPCETKSSGCLTFDLYAIKLDASSGRTYRIQVTNKCTGELQSVAIQLPDGTNAISPLNGATYTASSGRAYEVRTPNASPFYSIRFKLKPGSAGTGNTDLFEYKLPTQSAAPYILIFAKLANGDSYQAHLSTSGCPLVSGAEEEGLLDRSAEGLSADELLRIFPNPTPGSVSVTLPESWVGAAARLSVRNAQGQLVMETEAPVGGDTFPLNLPLGLSNGLYYVVAQTADGKMVAARCVVER